MQHFFDRFGRKIEALENQKTLEYKEGFNGLLKSYVVKKEDVLEHIRHRADDYNIFEVLGVKTLEAATHSPFIANLLNPKGSHAQRGLFYRRFIETIYCNNVEQKLLYINEENLEVVTEKSTYEGFIDVFIQHRSLNNPFCIIIENKIYAGDQYKQLERYYDYAKRVLKMDESNIYLIYLKDGTDASKDSMNLELQKQLKSTQHLVNLSYSKEITEFLINASIEVSAMPVKEVLKQYLKTIQYLGL